MGRRRIDIKPITDERARQVTLNKRKYGLFKKAYELGILCECEVALVIYDWKGRHYMFGDKIGDTLTRLANERSAPTDAHTQDTMLKLIEQREANGKRSRSPDDELSLRVDTSLNPSMTLNPAQRSALLSAGSKKELQAGSSTVNPATGMPFAKRASQAATGSRLQNHGLTLQLPMGVPQQTLSLTTPAMDLPTPTLQPFMQSNGDFNSPSTDMFNALTGHLPSLAQIQTGMLPHLALPTGGLTAALHGANASMGRSPGVMSTPTAGDIHVTEQRLLEARFQSATQPPSRQSSTSRQHSRTKTPTSMNASTTVVVQSPDEHVVARTLSNMAATATTSTTSTTASGSNPSTTTSASTTASTTAAAQGTAAQSTQPNGQQSQVPIPPVTTHGIALPTVAPVATTS
eukprot:m.43281 g.43281  ORF g.43281 m.43281 type:complete len:403 (+) comp12914_c0_seq1:164-1372(+)